MHDIGKVLIFTHNPGMYERVFEQIFESNCTSSFAESQCLGFDHNQVGLEAVRQWKLPPRFNNYMGQDISQPRAEMFADTVLLSLIAANYLVKTAGVGANKLDDCDNKKATLVSFGLTDDLCEQLSQNEFIESLMQNEIYKLCANIS
jgi:HD-like signal output (HDOD) protein